MSNKRLKQVIIKFAVFVVVIFFAIPKKVLLLVKSKLAFKKLLESGCKFELYFMHSLGGGTERYIRNILYNKNNWIIIRNYRFIKQEIYSLEIPEYKYRIFISKSDIQKLKKIVTLISVENLCGYKNLSFILDIIKCFPTKHIFKLHDFFSICPNYTLTKGNRYCSSPCPDSCVFQINGKELVSTDWHLMWKSFFVCVDEFFFFSESSMKIFTATYFIDSGKINIKPHDMSYFTTKSIKAIPDIMNIGIFGNINSDAKGLSVLTNFAEFSKGKDYRICINGMVSGIDFSTNTNCTYHGLYKSDEIYNRIISQNIGVVFFTSIWPETFSYVVSELMMTGIPIACFNLGAQAEKIKNYSLGKIIPEMTNESILATLKDCYEDGKQHYKQHKD